MPPPPTVPIPSPVAATLEIRWASRSVFLPLNLNPFDTGLVEMLGWISYNRAITANVESIAYGLIDESEGPALVIDQTSNPDTQSMLVNVPPSATYIDVPLVGSPSGPAPPSGVAGTLQVTWGRNDRTIFIPLYKSFQGTALWSFPVSFVGSAMRIGLQTSPHSTVNFRVPGGFDDPTFTQLKWPIPTGANVAVMDQMIPCLNVPQGTAQPPGIGF